MDDTTILKLKRPIHTYIHPYYISDYVYIYMLCVYIYIHEKKIIQELSFSVKDDNIIKLYIQ
ncbi:hypothetical protein C1645_752055 [Glomus cerebriforme]|uniref:Uncharacterized protein n=1 Tax=Glomus cerebriforme TaxID=658196 RepID=A0A397TMF5_9GLOM|nr:hypothetical protein C1645_752055 [Glomus cerebriforme]